MVTVPEMASKPALLLVDMQNGFCHPKGSAGRNGYDLTAQQKVVPKVADLVDRAHDSGLQVLWSRQEHLEDDTLRTSHAFPTHIDKGGYLPCLSGTWDAEILDDLKASLGDGDIVFVKHRASCFFNTVLDIELRMRRIDTLVVAGTTTNYCVDATIRDAYARDYDLLIVEDACACSFPDLHAATMKNAAMFHGRVVSTEEALDFLTSRRVVSHDG
jgi:ureidoacrylate peracid hydrolase